MRKILIPALALIGLISLSSMYRQSAEPQADFALRAENYKATLSEYGFFEGELRQLKPSAKLKPFFLNTPLFSDYAYKIRHIHVPTGAKIELKGNGIPEFPQGTILFKTFYYPHDFAKPEAERRIVETRLLVKEEGGWLPLCYIWDEDQKEARLNMAGKAVPVKWTDEKGQAMQLEYQVPSLLQCRDCHMMDNEVRPIGASARQLNGEYREAMTLPDMKGKNQLAYWKSLGWLGNEVNLALLDKMPVWNDPATGNLEQRARAWLSANCAHCHSPEASAEMTGLLLDYDQKDPTALGINKKPMGGLLATAERPYDIVPGHPEKSILVYRIAAEEKAIRMPKLFCQVPHQPGLELVSEWIKNMK